MPILLRLAARNLIRHPWRTLATILGVALGIAAVLATLSVGANVRANVQAGLEAAAGPAELLITPGAQGRAVMEAEPLRERVAGTPGVARFEPVLNVRIEPVRDVEDFERSVVPGVDSGFQVSGRHTERPAALPATLSAGRWPEAGEDTLAITDAFAGGRDLAIGDVMTFATRFGEVDLEIVGLMDASEGYAATNGARVAITHLETLQEVMRLEGRISHLEVLLADGALTREVKEALTSRLDASYAVASPAGTGEVAGGIVQTLQSGMLVLAVTLLALGGFMAYATFMAGVVERTREYALLRTIAMRRRDVQRLALVEAALLSALGAGVGIAMGVALAWVLTRVNAVGLGYQVHTLVVPAWSVIASVLLGFAVSLLAGVLPARSASAYSPLAAWRRSDTATAPARTGLGWALVALAVIVTRLPWEGYAALAGAGLAMVSFAVGTALAAQSLLRPALRVMGPLLARVLGVAGRLGASFAERSASRNGVAIGTVIIGTGLVVGVGALIAGINQELEDWVETTVVGDLFVTSPVSFPETFAERARAVEGIDVVSGVGLRAVRFRPEDQPRGRTVALVLVDTDRFHPDEGFGRFQYVQGQGDDRAGYQALTSPDGVLAASTMRRRFDLGVGSEVELRTEEGFQTFEVGGVVVDFTGGGEAFVASIAQMERFGGGTPDLYVMTVEEGREAGVVAERLGAAFPELYLDVTPNQAYQDRILALSNRTFVATHMLLVLAVIIAALGVANTLGMNLVVRGRELAMLRTFGMTRAGIRRVVMAEGIVVVITGSILGVAFGLLLADVVTAGASALTGYAIDPVVPWRLVGIALAASPAVGLLASLLPARRAGRLAPIVALRGTE
ncbi:MAG: FtsX-like permease family protein [Trueperaceae bacterium]|nr:FtsX-like permease family protein [Trueperaceae bacterium]